MRRKLGLIGKACIADDISQLKDVINSVNEQLLQTTSPSSLCFSGVFFTFLLIFDEALVAQCTPYSTYITMQTRPMIPP